MGSLNERLIRQYATHYRRVTYLDGSSGAAREYETQFGKFVHGLPQGSRVADLGCGIGLMLAWLATIPGIRVAGVDGSASQIERAREMVPEHVELHTGSLESFVLHNPATFHVIFAINILEHIPEGDNLLSLLEAVRCALVPGGTLVCQVPNAASLIGTHSRYLDLTHVRSFTSSSLVQLLECAGFERIQLRARNAVDFTQSLRMWVEYWVHRAVFHLCGRGNERHFAKDLIATACREPD